MKTRRVFGVCWSNPDKRDLSFCVFYNEKQRDDWLTEKQDYETREIAKLADYPSLRNALRQDDRALGEDDRISWPHG